MGSVVMAPHSFLVLDFLEWVQSVILTVLWMITQQHLLRVYEGDTFLFQSCLSLPNRLMKKVIMGKGWRWCLVSLATWISSQQGWPDCHRQMPNIPKETLVLSSQYRRTFLRRSARHSVSGWLHWMPSIVKVAEFASGDGFASSDHNASAGIFMALSSPTALPPSVPLLAAKDMKKWYQNHGHHWPDHEPGLVSGGGEGELLIEHSISHPLGDKVLLVSGSCPIAGGISLF